MDLAGPKLRTGPIKAGPSVAKCRPRRDVLGRVVTPARIWLTPKDSPEPAPGSAAARLPLPAGFLKTLRPGHKIRLRDARKAQRTLRVSHVHGRSCWAEGCQTVYFVPGLELSTTTRRKSGKAAFPKNVSKNKTARIGKLPALPQTLLVKEGDTLILTRSDAMVSLPLMTGPADFSPRPRSGLLWGRFLSMRRLATLSGLTTAKLAVSFAP
jgi:pyruvate kinase